MNARTAPTRLRNHWVPSLLAAVGVALAGSAPEARPVGPAASPMPAVAVESPEPARDTFPHVEHQGLFPFCTGCHEGVPSGDAATFYPEASFCVGCHDGVEVVEIEWTPPVPDAKPDNLAFSHPEHGREVEAEGDAALGCQTCHAEPGAARMVVEPLRAERCLSCHAHPAERHVVDAECSTCHVPLARTELPGARIASFEEPPSHGQPGFVLELHGREATDGTARCATCHTRDQCTSCHVGGAADVIGRLEPAPATWRDVPRIEARYPAPASHADPDFEVGHGRLIEEEGGAACITCHTRDDCASCHLPPLPRGAASLPARSAAPAPGVGLSAESPSSHDTPFFVEDHGTLAAADPDGCASCHTQTFCQSCHEAPDRPVFHPPDYATRHAADAWGGATECASCHQVQVSCRACHAEAGLTGTGARLGSGYHDAEPLWLFRHGQAARQSLESCASCHAQRECQQCHSEIGSFQVKPHGPGFDAERARAKNPQICRACHIGDPLGGGG